MKMVQIKRLLVIPTKVMKIFEDHGEREWTLI